MGALHSLKKVSHGGRRPKIAAASIIDSVESGGLMYDGLHLMRSLDFPPDLMLFVLITLL